ncbi:MAG: hypothetical protein A3F11_05515 [Gammaproteobacteria bacterium RIFCSPHIGHO2_12_FULL_37_14]|nr:MAG: hypothetical protein A3F11_05515 [Gammaproteobacteria bacterium RIFCSPHIGHO2_12_FULL_37_14]
MQNRDNILEELKTDSQKYIYSGYTFSVPTIGKKGSSLTPKPYRITKCTYHSRILEDLHSVWDINKFKVARAPLEVGELVDRRAFQCLTIRVLDMPIKLAGSNDYKIPDEIHPFIDTIQMIVNHEHSILSEQQLLSYHAYLTIDQSEVKAGTMQRKPGAHVDGFQGARIFPKTLINHSYVVSNGTPTIFYPHSFDFSYLNEGIHDYFLEMDTQAKDSKAIRTKPYSIYLMDAYTVHRADLATENCFRTFLRVSYDVKVFDRLGNTINPLLSYSWNMVPREVQSTLVRYQSLNDYEKELIGSSKFKNLCRHMDKLKNSNLERYYNFSYMGLQSKKINVIKLILKKLSETDKPNIQELRLMFIAATQKKLDISQLGIVTLIAHLRRGKNCIKSNLLLDFILEMVTQKSCLLSKKLLIELIKGQEQTTQGKDIMKFIEKFRESKNQAVNSSCFWHTANKMHEKPIRCSLQLRAKL